MIVVRHSVVIDEPLELAGFLWADFVQHRIADREFVPDEWLDVDDDCGVLSTGDVSFEAASAARTRITLSLKLDLRPSDPDTGPEVEATFRSAVARLDRFHDFADARVG